MAKDQIITEEHHRRACSIGGTSKPSNISYVKSRDHRAWHILFGNMNAYQVCTCINHIRYKPEGLLVVCKFINGAPVRGWGQNNSKNEYKISYAWHYLFNGMDFLSIIHYINNVWFDPSYHLYVEKIEVKEEDI